MCGKFTQMNSWQGAEAFTQHLGVANGTDEIVISTPMRLAKIMRLNALGERELVEMRWGFAGKDDTVPSRPKHMHARGETVDRLPTFAQAFACSRGILMVHTFNEGEELARRQDQAVGHCPAGRPARSHRRDLRRVAQRRGNASNLRASDDARQHADLAHHRSHAGGSAARNLGYVARRNGRPAGGGEGSVADI